jgi:hypothetical protein
MNGACDALHAPLLRSKRADGYGYGYGKMTILPVTRRAAMSSKARAVSSSG